MTVIIVWLVVIALVVAFLAFVAKDDRNNRRIRAEEDRLKGLEDEARAERKAD